MCEKLRKEILDFFPSIIFNNDTISDSTLNEIQEIRVRVGQPISMKLSFNDIFVGESIRQEYILKLLENFSNNSIYAIQSELNSGYLTIKGGHRIGISGTCIIENETVKNIKYISSLNIRVAREIKGCSQKIFQYINKDNEFENTLIISPPRLWQDNIT